MNATPEQRSRPTAAAERSSLDARAVLHLGSGRKYRDDAVNVDVVADVSPDLVLDLNRTPWPFPDSRFTSVLAYDVLEHLDDVVAAMEEIHRVCKHGARVEITVPHFSCANAFADVTHKRFFTKGSFNFLVGEHALDFYSRRRFRSRTAQIVFRPTLANKVVRRLANRFPEPYEQRWAWMFPAWFLHFELEVVKG